MLIQDRKTGQWYDPEKEFNLLFTFDWFKKIMIRLKFR